MAKRKKYPKLPNGFGSIKYLGKNRRNPYAVHPPTKEFSIDGVPKTPKALCYVDSWIKGFSVLAAYHTGTYTPDLLSDLSIGNQTAATDIITSVLGNFHTTIRKTPETSNKTFSDVYEAFFEYKFERDHSRKYALSTLNSTRAAYRNCSTLHDLPFRTLRHSDLQSVIDSCTLSHASKEIIVNLLKQMYQYAEIYELCDKNYAAHIKINSRDDEKHGVPFSDAELQTLWKHKEYEVVEMILIMCLSGFRISAYKTLTVNTCKGFFQGGVKTTAGKNRVVPIHSSILPLVKLRMKRYNCLLPCSVGKFREDMKRVLQKLNITTHTPHDCRHTFSALCERYKVNENDRKRMLGHSFGSDITNQVYGHRELNDLREEIEKIKICY